MENHEKKPLFSNHENKKKNIILIEISYSYLSFFMELCFVCYMLELCQKTQNNRGGLIEEKMKEHTC